MENPCQRGLRLAGPCQFAPQAFGTVGHRPELIVLHAPQPGQNGPLPVGQIVEHRGPEQGRRGLRHIGRNILPRRQQAPQGCGRWMVRMGRCVVVATGAVDGMGRHGAAPLSYGLTIFNGQNVIGPPQQLRPASQFLQGRRPGGGIGQAPVQEPQQQPVQVRVQETLCRLHQGVRLAVFAAETQGIHTAQAVGHRHSPVGKPLRRGQGRRQGQFQHQAGPAGHGGPGPDRFFVNRRFPPLDEIAAHDANNGGIGPEVPAHQVQLPGVAPVQGIVFADNGHHRPHGIPPIKNR